MKTGPPHRQALEMAGDAPEEIASEEEKHSARTSAENGEEERK